MSNEKMFEALKTIKEICSKHEKCRECPLYNGECGIQDTAPEGWIIKEPPKPTEYHPFE